MLEPWKPRHNAVENEHVFIYIHEMIFQGNTRLSIISNTDRHGTCLCGRDVDMYFCVTWYSDLSICTSDCLADGVVMRPQTLGHVIGQLPACHSSVSNCCGKSWASGFFI